MKPPADPEQQPAAATCFAQLTAALLAASGLLVALGWSATLHRAGSAGVRAMLIACGLNAAIAILAAWVSVRRVAGKPHELATGVLAGMALRLGLTLLAVAVVVFGQLAVRKPFLFWIAAGYGTLLLVESWALMRIVRRASLTWPGRAEGGAC